MRKSDLIGQTSWHFRPESTAIQISGTDPIFGDPNATKAQLEAALPPEDRGKLGAWYCQQWQRVGRSIKRLTVKEYP